MKYKAIRYTLASPLLSDSTGKMATMKFFYHDFIGFQARSYLFQKAV